ncbi:hypothetical protein JW752_02740 [Candidatus Peregrinibacteria bacterium]|nr:hypothetical protein [Candidatus Peregrinibacteria bacterium]
MELSIFIAQLYALGFLALGLGMLLSPGYYKKSFQAMMKEPGLVLLGGMLALLFGFLIVTRHNVWEGWPALITIFGWIAVLKGVSLIIFPGVSMPMFESWFKNKTFLQAIGVGTILFGAFLAYVSFF